MFIKRIALFCFAAWLCAGSLPAISDEPLPPAPPSDSQVAPPITRKRPSKRIAITVTVIYILISIGMFAGVFLIYLAMRRRQKNVYMHYAAKHIRERAAIHRERELQEKERQKKESPPAPLPPKSKPSPLPSPPDNYQLAMQRLAVLKDLRVRGFITEADYQEKKKSILHHL